MKFLSFALLSALTACGVSSSDSFQKAETFALPGTVVDDAVAAQLVGTYAVLININSEASMPIFGKTVADNQLFRISTISKAANGGLQMHSKACSAKFLSNGPLKLSVDDEQIQALPEQTIPVRAWASEDGTVNLVQDTQTIVAGAVLKDPANDKLPTDAKDPRIVDANKDGNPDFTAKVNGGFLASGTVWFVQRSTSSFEGALQSNGEIVAMVKDKTEQSIVKATNPLLRVKLPEAKQVLEKSYARFSKLNAAASKADCAAVDFDQIFAD